MSLARKRSHPIHVDGIDYRWVVSARTLSSPSDVLVVIQPEEGGQRLLVTTPCHVWYDMHEPPPKFSYPSITPALVRRMIHSAIKIVWHPEHSGKELHVQLQSDESVVKVH